MTKKAAEKDEETTVVVPVAERIRTDAAVQFALSTVNAELDDAFSSKPDSVVSPGAVALRQRFIQTLKEVGWTPPGTAPAARAAEDGDVCSNCGHHGRMTVSKTPTYVPPPDAA